MRLRAIVIAGLTSAALCGLSAQAMADGSVGPIYNENGDSAVATDECGPGDGCATVTLAGGDTIKVLTGGSGRCNPYVMTFMRYHAGQLDRVWSTPTDRNADASGGPFSAPQCGNFRNTHMLLDGGAIDLGIFQKKNGSVFVLFFGGSSTPSKP